MATNLTKNLENLDKNNAQFLSKIHPKHRGLFTQFIQKCFDAGEPIWIFSSLRSIAQQQALVNAHKKNKNKPYAAPAGLSLHNYGLAIDVYVYNKSDKTFSRYPISQYRKISKIAISLGLRWGGNFSNGNEHHHFDYKAYDINSLLKLYKNREVDSNGFVLLERATKDNAANKTGINQSYNTTLGESLITDVEEKIEEEKTSLKTFNLKTEKTKANGIWQIVKLVADQYSLSQTINDATIAHNQGSLFNFIQNVIQEPWLQFFGDTVDNKFFFFARKEPFDYNGFSKLPFTDNILAEQVLAEDLSWYDGPIFSWYQIIPKGSFLGEQNLIFAYVTAVFFEEYADIWGSKPNIQISNYINFAKSSNKATLFEKALEDLRYMVESNAYLPFSRQGTITIKGKTNIKRGYKIKYLPTREIYYVSAVSNRFTITESGPEYITVLKVERGMKIDHFISPEDTSTKSYFNLILFENEKPKNVKRKVDVPASSGNFNIFFDNARSYTIDLDEKFGNTREDLKMKAQIAQFPNLRTELYNSNKRNISAISNKIEKNPKATGFKCTGYIDSDALIRSRNLPKKRAETLKKLIIEDYTQKYKTFSKSQLESMISIHMNFAGATYNPRTLNEENKFEVETNIEAPLKLKAYERYAGFSVDAYSYEEDAVQESNEMGWKVNREVFQYFLNRKQNG